MDFAFAAFFAGMGLSEKSIGLMFVIWVSGLIILISFLAAAKHLENQQIIIEMSKLILKAIKSDTDDNDSKKEKILDTKI